MIRAWLTAFLFTQLVEVPIYVRATGCSIAGAFGASAITHPIVWFVFFGSFWAGPRDLRIVTAELFAWLLEAAYLRHVLGRRRALVWAFVANAASFGLGLLSRHLFGVP